MKSLLVLILWGLTSAPAAGQSRDLRFARACDAGTQVTISAVGDLLLHGSLQRQAYSSKLGFRSLWQQAIPYFKNSDLAYANLEGPTALGRRKGGGRGTTQAVYDGSTYSGYPMFNYHPRLISDLVQSGIDVVSTANNHSLDRGSQGANLTIDALEGKNLLYTGTRKTNRSNPQWHTITEIKGQKIAWLACTYGTNGIPDRRHQVLNCFNKDRVTGLIRSLRNTADAIIVTPHWGYEYKLSANHRQKKYARRWLDAGAAAVIGNHPHVPQPWEKYTTKDGRETVAIYSLGNFVSAQGAMKKRATILFYLGLTFRGSQAWVNGVRYVPAYMNNRGTGSLRLLVGENFTRSRSLRNQVLGLLRRQYGSERIVRSGEKIVTNPECS